MQWPVLTELMVWLPTYWAEIAALLTVMLAIAVTLHVVMHKRDSGTAAAWTGLVWLVPVLGALLYLLLGINRIHRRARSLVLDQPVAKEGQEPQVQPKPVPEHLHSLGELSSRITGLNLTAGNDLTCLEAPLAFQQMLDAINNARESVYLATYIFGNDEAGRTLIQALSTAVQRGVRVRVLIDGAGLFYTFPTVLGRMRREGIVTERFLYSWAPWRMTYMNLRNHRKLMIVDRQLGFTGGMNIRGGYIQHPPTIRDVHARVEGPVVGHMLRSFIVDWHFTCGEVLDERYSGSLVEGNVLARGINAGPDGDFDKRRLALLGAISSAQQEIRIITPYFVPDQTLLTALELACMRGVRVQLMLPAKSNLRLVQWAGMHLLPWLVEKGCELFFSPTPFDHSKLMTVDRQWCMLGSGNWDARSLRLNFEFDLECYSHALTDDMNRLFDLRRANARRISLDDLIRVSYPRRVRHALAFLLAPYL